MASDSSHPELDEYQLAALQIKIEEHKDTGAKEMLVDVDLFEKLLRPYVSSIRDRARS